MSPEDIPVDDSQIDRDFEDSCTPHMPNPDDPNFINKIIKQVDDEAAELAMLRNFRDEVGAAIANEGPHTIEHLMACSMLGKHTTVIGRKRLGQLNQQIADLQAKLAEVTRERDRYLAFGNAEYDGAQHARHGGSINDCPYGPMKADGFRDAEMMGCWQRGHDLVANKAKLSAIEAAFAKVAFADQSHELVKKIHSILHPTPAPEAK